VAGRKRTGRSRRRRRTSGRWKNVLIVLVLFLATAVSVMLAVPSEGFPGTLRSWMIGELGWLSVLVPLFLFLAGARLLGLGFSGAGFRILSALAVTGYFFTAVLDFVVSAGVPEFHGVPGGKVAAGIGEILVPLTGAPIAFLVLFTAFTTSLVVFTGWDIGGDLRSLALKVRTLLGGMKSRRKPERDVAGPEEDSRDGAGSAWIREEPEVVPDVPFRVEPVPAPEESRPFREERKRVETRREIRTPEPVRRQAEWSDCGDDGYVPPPISCLEMPDERHRVRMTREKLKELEDLLLEKLMDFGIECRISNSYPGPVITRFEVEPGPGIKVNKFVALSDDLAMALRAKRIRILAPVPGRGAVGIEVPNPVPETVYLREVIEEVGDEIIPVALGKKVRGEPFAADLTSMPHLLIAGATGSGKSVCIHSIIASILLTRRPSEVKLAMIDPKMLELSIYEDIPHLWAPVVIEREKSTLLLDALVKEMESRYKRLARIGVRSIREFNSKLSPESEGERIPYIVLIIDELADLMITVSREIEPAIERLAQMARAVGIHMVLATQRPSVDVITGVIKANFPSRIAFNVQSKTDSRTILDMNGAEKLLGKGDMLFLAAASPEPLRVHGSFISTEETRTIVEHLRDQPEVPYEYEFPEEDASLAGGSAYVEMNDPLFETARDIVVSTQQGSISILQRKLKVGYSRAARLIDMLEQAGIVGQFQGSKAREVLVSPEELERTEGDDGEV